MTAAYQQDVTLRDREPGEVDLAAFHDCPICGKMFFAFIDLYDSMSTRSWYGLIPSQPIVSGLGPHLRHRDEVKS